MTSSKRRLRPAVLISATLLLAPLARGAGLFPPQTDVWIRIETRHLDVYSNASESRAVEVAENLEILRHALLTLTRPDDPEPARRTVVFLFRNRRSFEPYRDRVTHSSGAVGLFVRGDSNNFIASTLRAGTGQFGAIYHEYVHDFLATFLPGVPLWFNEGLSELFASFEHDDATARIGLPRTEHIKWLVSRELAPVDELFVVTSDSRDYRGGSRQGTFYAESWLATHYFFLGGGDRSALQKYLAAVSAGRPETDAFAASFDQSPEQMTRRLAAYARRSSFSWIQFPIAEAAPIARMSTTVRVDRAEILHQLGNLLFHSGPDNLTEAVEHYREALAADPRHPGANSALGTILYSKGRRSEAAVYLARATESMTNDSLPYLLHGKNLLDRIRNFRITFAEDAPKPPEVDRARKLFERSLELNPGDPHAHAGIGSTYLFESGDVRPGIDALELATERMPNRVDLWVYLEILHLKNADRASAKSIVDERIAPSGDDDLIQSARRALVAWDVDNAARLAREGNLEEAASILRAAAAMNDDESLSATLVGDLQNLDRAIEIHRLTALYNDAVRAANEYDYTAALEILRRIVHDARDEELSRDATALVRTIEGFQRAESTSRR